MFRMEEVRQYYRFRPDEIFRRVNITALLTLMLEQAKLEMQVRSIVCVNLRQTVTSFKPGGGPCHHGRGGGAGQWLPLQRRFRHRRRRGGGGGGGGDRGGGAEGRDGGGGAGAPEGEREQPEAAQVISDSTCALGYIICFFPAILFSAQVPLPLQPGGYRSPGHRLRHRLRRGRGGHREGLWQEALAAAPITFDPKQPEGSRDDELLQPVQLGGRPSAGDRGGCGGGRGG